jgi:methionyl aminopeptidase
LEISVNDLHRGRQTKDGIRIYDPSDFAGMHAAGRLAATILELTASSKIW